jgi:alpha-1,3-fucosyltransferase
MGAWFVSNCNVPSRRDILVQGLQRYFPVDVYGRCGRFKCPRLSNHCHEILDKDYKFYMSFENSLCDDYVTEKFFGTMKRLIVPVVYGGADYSIFAPPHSYINANDFASVKDLAEHLMFLDRNPKEYVKYFWWKQYYRIEEPTPYCDLCQQLHNIAERGERKHYRDIDNWWTTNRCKSKARIKF